MDRNIINALYKRGLITTVNCDLSKYNSIEDFIARNVSYVGAMPIINDIIKKYANDILTDDNSTITIIDKPEVLETVVEIKEDEIVEVTEVDETEVPTEEIVDAVEVVEETPVETVEETPVETVEETPVETVEETPKKKKSTKKTE